MSPLKLLKAFALTMLLVIILPAGQVEPGLAETRERPNIVIILTDDLDSGSISVMPKLHSLLIEQGTTFNNAFVTDPLCCPSRATFLRGQYSHNTTIQGNSPPEGGHEKFRRLGLDRSTVATWLDDAGYDTIYLGKYMNGYDDTRYVPPGWDRWFGWLGNYYGSGSEYRLNENGHIQSYDQDHLHDTDLLSEKAVTYIRNQRGDGRPFFMYLAPNAPHTPAYVPKRHEGMFSNRSLPRPPSFNEEDISDKPEVVKRPELGHSEVEELGDLYRKRLAALQSVDGMVNDVVGTLQDTGQLDSTYIVFTSDNGFLFGEHRRVDKSLPYEESIRVPFIVRGPGVAHQRLNHLLINNDFAPTVAELAGVAPPSFVDGKSFVPLLGREKPGLEQWRMGFLVEHLTPTYQAIRTNRYTYVEWSGGATELYDLEADPYQLDSRHETATLVATTLSARLEALRGCEAAQCRAAEIFEESAQRP
jgi:N-acetylglucosamine-6-sulfatase